MIFDEWRERYDSMTLRDQIAFHQEIWETYPDQHQHSDDAPVRAFFNSLPEKGYYVLEIGGWTGDAARRVLGEVGEDTIRAWTNIELSAEAVALSYREVDSLRYGAFVPREWPWDSWWPQDILFLQHVAEHIRFEEFKQLVWHVPNAEWIFIQSPLDLGPRDWTGYSGAHIFEGGWMDITSFLRMEGFEMVSYPAPGTTENSRTYIFRRGE